MIRVIQLINKLSQSEGGPSDFVPGLCRALSRHSDLSVELHVRKDFTMPPDPEYRSRDFSKDSDWCFFQEVSRLARESQVLHSHGLWRLPSFLSDWVTRGTNCRHLISTHGMLLGAAYQYKSWRKKISLAFGQRGALDRASCLHATSLGEVNELRALGLRAPVALIPNGVEIPRAVKSISTDGSRRVLFLGRLHPIKGLEVLLRAWKRVSEERMDWSLHLVGPGDPAYRVQLENLAQELKLNNVFFEGPSYGEKRDAWFRRAELLVLPSQSENFGMVVAQAMSHGTPVVASQGTPWQELTKKGCGWWVKTEGDALIRSLLEATAMSPQQLLEMGIKGRHWVEVKFSWEIVASQFRETYLWCLGSRSRPEWVH